MIEHRKSGRNTIVNRLRVKSRWAGTFLWLLAGLSGSVQAGWTQSVHYREARERFDKGEFLLAMLAAQKAVEEDGAKTEHLHLYGAVLLELKQYSEAEEHLRKAVASEPDRAEYQHSLGELLLARTLEEAILKETRSGVGQPRMRNVDPEGLKALERAVELDPDLLEARLRLGRAYYDLNRHDLALEQFEAIARKNPRYPWIHSSRAVVYMNAGDVDSAVQALQAELRNFPDHHSARLELGEALLKAGDTARAAEHLVRLKEEDVSPADRVALNHSLAKAYRDLGQLEKALTASRRALELDPDFPDGHYLLAQLYEQAGQADLARRQMDTFRRVQREKRQRTLGPLQRGRR
jgi:tetratricopeptide (TPR) repeat protein